MDQYFILLNRYKGYIVLCNLILLHYTININIVSKNVGIICHGLYKDILFSESKCSIVDQYVHTGSKCHQGNIQFQIQDIPTVICTIIFYVVYSFISIYNIHRIILY